jgi:hypothetical protein
MGASTTTTFASLLKTRYTPDKVQSLTYTDRPLLALLAKSTEFSGDGMKIPVIDVNPQGVAAQSLSIAQGAQTSLSAKHFTLTVGDYYGSVEIGGKVMALSRNNMGAFLENKVAEIDALYEQIANNLHIHLWGNGGGSLGTRASISGNIVTLGDASDVFAFEVGMTVAASANDGSDTGHALRSGTTTVASRSPEAGTVTLTDQSLIVSFANSDHLFRYGDFFGNTGAGIIKGVQAYITATASPAALFGMTRTSDPIKLAGCRVASGDLTGLSDEDRIKKLGAYMKGRYQAKVGKHAFMHPEDWQQLEVALNSRGIRSLDEQSTGIGFATLNVTMGGTNVRIYCDHACPKGTFFVMNLDNWKLWSAGELIRPVQADGLTILRKSTTNDFEYRLESWPQLACNAPLNNGRVTLNA